MDVSLFRSQLLELFDYDRDSGKLFWKVAKARIVKIGQEAGTINSKGYRQVKIDGKKYNAHRLIFLIECGHLPDCLDHVNGIRDDNRIENLRECSPRENSRNTSKKSSNTSGIVGVYRNKARNKWQAQCSDKYGKQTHLGLFTDIQLAAEVVKAFRLQEHGEFAADLRHK